MQSTTILFFDNATTHLKCKEDALSATKMPKFTPAMGKNWGVEVDKLDEDYHTHSGVFKGMAAILQECGFTNTLTLWAQCKNFKCTETTVNCCCHRILYNQLDFVNVPSKLERLCKPQGYQQCWCYSKLLYHQYPALSKEANLKCNVLTALDSVPLVVMQCFVTHAHHFVDTYAKGLQGKAAKKYRGH
ncbi:hypothetical protein PILCRDRAFT_97548 [Piloderma croceum F 1598]|uniref:Uncharacterized protein n=1 Tax=Piloderma croceum (strain F 1598) TaxID=765440 RepID=A0A0C3BX20_PILCF|nr:hypothetical protein PILCRDRAFT_97548 [Piloderma croceum F 1598]